MRHPERVSHTVGHVASSSECINSGTISSLVANDKINFLNKYDDDVF